MGQFFKKNACTIVGVLLILFSLMMYFVIIPSQVKHIEGYGISPQTFPKLMAVLLFVFSVIYTIQSCMNKEQETSYSHSSREQFIRFIVTILITVIYIMCIGKFGYIVSTIIALGAYLYMFGVRDWKITVPIMIITPIMIKIFFTCFLNMVLPRGMFI